MKILIHANHYPVCSARYAAAAFRRMGHEVRTVGNAMGRHVWGLDLPTWAAWEPGGDYALSMSKMVMPDVVIVMDSDPDVLDETRQYSSYGCPVIVWGVDNHVRDYRRVWFDHYFLAHKAVSVMDWRDDMTHLPCAYDPDEHTPSPIAWHEREYDVAMVGVMYPRRWEIVKRLRAAGLRVFAGTGLIGESYRDAYHNARVAVCDSVAGDVAQRVFEASAMGCAVVADRCADMDTEGFIAAWEWTYARDDLKEAVELCQYAQGFNMNPVEHKYGREWLQAHTWDARAQQIIKWVEVQREAKAVS